MPKFNFLVWNSTGYKQELLEELVANYKIDFVILVEGGQDDKEYKAGGKTMHLTGISDSHGQSGFTLDATEVVAIHVNKSPNVRPTAGKSKGSGYLYSESKECKLSGAVKYEDDAVIKAWVFEPIREFKEKKDKADGPKDAKDAKSASAVSSLASGREKRVIYTKKDEDFIAATTKPKFSARVNLLGGRRPFRLDFEGLSLFFWHAPLGAEYNIATEIEAKYLDSTQAAGNGMDACAANWFFCKYLCQQKAKEAAVFPRKTVLTGDLNINSSLVATIYGVKPQVTSGDGWCHVVASTDVKVTQLGEVIKNEKATWGDHTPMLFSLEW